MSIQFKATPRDAQGSGASRRLRRAGSVPGIIYGADKAPLTVTFDHNELFHLMKREVFHSSVLAIEVDGQTETVILRDVQYHAYKPQIMHVDFQRVDATHKIHVKVPLHFINADVAPGVKLGGGTVSHVMTELEVQCLPGSLPEYITVDLANVEAGQSLHVSDLAMPAGVEALTHGQNPVVAAVSKPAAE